jgi:hypothetical protein
MKNGVVVLDDPASIPNGVLVSVRPLKARRPQRSAPKTRRTVNERYSRCIGLATDMPPDFSINHDHYLYGTPKRK